LLKRILKWRQKDVKFVAAAAASSSKNFLHLLLLLLLLYLEFEQNDWIHFIPSSLSLFLNAIMQFVRVGTLSCK
jgi:hypothetical protein